MAESQESPRRASLTSSLQVKDGFVGRHNGDGKQMNNDNHWKRVGCIYPTDFSIFTHGASGSLSSRDKVAATHKDNWLRSALSKGQHLLQPSSLAQIMLRSASKLTPSRIPTPSKPPKGNLYSHATFREHARRVKLAFAPTGTMGPKKSLERDDSRQPVRRVRMSGTVKALVDQYQSQTDRAKAVNAPPMRKVLVKPSAALSGTELPSKPRIHRAKAVTPPRKLVKTSSSPPSATSPARVTAKQSTPAPSRRTVKLPVSNPKPRFNVGRGAPKRQFTRTSPITTSRKVRLGPMLLPKQSSKPAQKQPETRHPPSKPENPKIHQKAKPRETKALTRSTNQKKASGPTLLRLSMNREKIGRMVPSKRRPHSKYPALTDNITSLVQVTEAQPRQYWLGRFVTLINAFHYEDSFSQPDVATGFGMLSSYSRPLGRSNRDPSEYRIKRVFMVLENVCMTPQASKSLRQFRNEFVEVHGNQWMK